MRTIFVRNRIFLKNESPSSDPVDRYSLSVATQQINTLPHFNTCRGFHRRKNLLLQVDGQTGIPRQSVSAYGRP